MNEYDMVYLYNIAWLTVTLCKKKTGQPITEKNVDFTQTLTITARTGITTYIAKNIKLRFFKNNMKWFQEMQLEYSCAAENILQHIVTLSDWWSGLQTR